LSLGNNGAILRVNHVISGDELVVSVLVGSKSDSGEFRVYLYDSQGALVNKEPDFFWKNIGYGQTETITVSSKGHYFDIDDFKGGYSVRLYTQGMAFEDEKAVSLFTGDKQEVQPSGVTSPDTGTPFIPEGSPTTGGGSGGLPYDPPTEGGSFDFGDFFKGLGTGGLIALAVGAVLLLKK